MNTKLSLPRVSAMLLAGGCLASCHTGASLPAVGPGVPAACLIAGAAQPRAALTVAITEAVDPTHAPVARNDAERLVFRQIYETLVTVDCEGNIRPALAHTWSADSEGRVWTLRLRRNARFSDGSPVTTRDVIASWQQAAGRAIQSVTVSSDVELVVELFTPSQSPRIFAHPDFAVAREGSSGPWPDGSGAFHVVAGSDARVIRIASAAGAVEFRRVGQAEPRSALDTGIDVLVAHDARVIEYARARTDYLVTPLPWNRTYVLVAGDSVSAPSDQLEALARDAVRMDARPAEPPFWWTDPGCLASFAGSGTRPAPTRRIIVYPQEDDAARSIAERIVSLAWPVSSAPAWLRELLPAQNAASAPSVVALDRGRFRESVRTGSTLAILPLPRAPRGKCPADTHAFGDSLLAHLFRSGAPAGITPLLDTHAYLIHRREIGAVTVDGAGTLLFGGAAR